MAKRRRGDFTNKTGMNLLVNPFGTTDGHEKWGEVTAHDCNPNNGCISLRTFMMFPLPFLLSCSQRRLPSRQPATCCKWCIKTPNAGPTPFRHFPVWAVCARSCSRLPHGYCKQETLLYRCMNVPSTVTGELVYSDIFASAYSHQWFPVSDVHGAVPFSFSGIFLLRICLS